MIIQAEGLGRVGPKSGRTKSGLVFSGKKYNGPTWPKIQVGRVKYILSLREYKFIAQLGPNSGWTGLAQRAGLKLPPLIERSSLTTQPPIFCYLCSFFFPDIQFFS